MTSKSNIKGNGQVFTPSEIVKLMLDEVGYTSENVLGKTIMEPSFGNGAFIIEIVSRIIKESEIRGKTAEETKQIIEQSVYGIEQDEGLYNEAIERLNNLLTEHSITPPKWSNLLLGDTMLLYNNFIDKFDYCVGNPPYVRIHNIEQLYRNTLRNFTFASGTTDLYIIFYELGIRMIKRGSGKLAYITPNSFLKNASQRRFRNYLINQGLLTAIYDFKTSKIFDADTYTCICILDNNLKFGINDVIEYREYDMYTAVVQDKLSYEYFRNYLQDIPWALSSASNIEFLQRNAERPIKVKDIAIVQNGIATNKDSIFIGRAWLDKECVQPYFGKHTDKGRIVYFNGYGVESTLLHRCIKGSKYDGTASNLYILYPYHNDEAALSVINDNGVSIEASYIAYTEDELNEIFPNAYKYLLAHKAELMERDIAENTDWFIFGRSQGLVNSGYKKLVFKHIVNKASPLNIYMVDEDVIVYAGVYITLDTANFITNELYFKHFNSYQYDKELQNVQSVLSDDDFKKYCLLVGKDMQGGYVYLSSEPIKNYGTGLEQYPEYLVSNGVSVVDLL